MSHKLKCKSLFIENIFDSYGHHSLSLYGNVYILPIISFEFFMEKGSK